MTPAELERRLYPPAPQTAAAARPLPDWAVVGQELKHKGVTRQSLWSDYRQDHPEGIGYTVFCEMYAQWARTVDPRMRQVHKAGERLFVDYAGQTIAVVDRATGEVREAQMFVAVLGASDYTYAEPTWTQSVPDWIGSHTRAFAFIGGVPELVVPDNLKAGVTSACFYEPDINPTYLEMARHYGVAILPARPRKPRDKAKVEKAVQDAESAILAPLRHLVFHDLCEVRAAIRERLDAFNRRHSKYLGASRLELFERIDKPVLRPLPAQPYEFAEWQKARVNIDYHVSVEDHWYSVPHPLIHKQVEVRLAANTIEFFYANERVASHLRSGTKYAFTTNPEHMPEGHRAYSEWSPERFLRWAGHFGPNTRSLIERLLVSRSHPQQAYRACLGILRLGQQHGPQRLEAAATRAIAAGAIGYKHVNAILRRSPQQDAPSQTCLQLLPVEHENIRGSAYYGDTEGAN